MFKHLGNFVTKNRSWVILVWVVLAAFMFFSAPSLKDVGIQDYSTFLHNSDTESTRAGELMQKYFPGTGSASSVSLIFYDEKGLSDSDLAYGQQVRDWLKSDTSRLSIDNTISIYDNPDLKATLVSQDNTTMIMNVSLSGAMSGPDSVQIIRQYLDSSPSGLESYVSGEVGIMADLQDAVLSGLDKTILITIIFVIVLLLIIYRSPIASLVPLLTIGMAYLVSRGAMGFIAQAGVSVWSQMDTFLIVLVFGVGTDYCLFLVSRFREELHQQDNRVSAMRLTLGRIGVVITASAFTVIIALSGMAIARFQMIQTMGPLMALSVFITLLAAVTLAPAFASIMGKYLFWPFHEQNTTIPKETKSKQGSFFQKIARLSTGKPGLVIIIVLVVLGLPCLAIPKLNNSFDIVKELPQGSDSVAGYNVLEKHYDIGEMEPANIIIVAPEGGDLTSPQALAALSKLSGDLSRIDGVVKVKSIINPQGTTGAMAELTVSGQLTTLSTALDGFGGDITALFSPETAAGFQQISAYLTELNANFTWVKENSDYQEALVSLNNMQTVVAQIKTGASVTNQLQYLVSQLSQANGASTTAFTPVQANQYLQLIAAYLNELVQQYPALQSDSNYLTALEACNGGLTLLEQMSQLPESQQVAVGTQLQSGIQALTTSLTGLASTFQKQDAYMVSQVLARASGTDSTATATALQSSLVELKTHLQSLSSQFASRDNPVFLSPTLLSASPSFQGLVNMFVSENRQSTLLYVVLDSFSASDRAIQTIDSIRTTLSSSVQGTILPGSEIATGGSSATYTDIKHMVDTDFNRIIILVVIFTFLILVFILRSLIAPMYLLLAVLLSYGATMGLMTLIFQTWLGQEGIFFLIPIITFVLLIALGSDYNIFLMSRIREESDKTGTRDGVRVAAIATGAVILACGVVLAGTFAALSSSPILFMVQFGISVAIGVLIDTAIIQVFLLPAIATKLGKWNWWPSKRG